jgi:glycosyltransferase involved in cell wall biosynthesis
MRVPSMLVTDESETLSTSVVVPAFNEEHALRAMVEDVRTALGGRAMTFEIVIIENGSSDATAAIAAALADEHPEVRASSDPRADYGAALKRGLLMARGRQVVTFDVDFYDIEFLDRALQLLDESGAGIVVGTKRGEGSRDERPLVRRLVTAGFALVLRRGFGLRASDTHGMKAMDRERVRPLAERCQLGTDLFDTELVLRAERAGVGVVELPVVVTELRPPRSSIGRRVLRTPVGLVRLKLALRS